LGQAAEYVIALLEELLGPATAREKRFPWAIGDVSPKTGRAVQLPFDAFWEERRLLVEVDEEQHKEPVLFFDKPEIMTVSGVHRGEQRKLYDKRKRTAARRRRYRVLVIEWPRRRPRDRERDIVALQELLDKAGIPHPA
jgi:hypothetical protein